MCLKTLFNSESWRSRYDNLLKEKLIEYPGQVPGNITGLAKGGLHRQPKAASKELRMSHRFCPAKDPSPVREGRFKRIDRDLESKAYRPASVLAPQAPWFVSRIYET